MMKIRNRRRKISLIPDGALFCRRGDVTTPVSVTPRSAAITDATSLVISVTAAS
jgi:hypothetical protein